MSNFLAKAFKTSQVSFTCRTLKERAERLFSTKGKRLEDLDPSLLAKAKPGKTAKTAYVYTLYSGIT